MLAFGIRYLNGFVAASEPDFHDRPEWPPHPGRIFMALAAAHFETGADARERDRERAALKWLEEIPTPPTIQAACAIARAFVTHYVPVNDKAIWKKDPAKPESGPPPPLQSASGIIRVRNERMFARAWLDDETAFICWPEAEPPREVREALETLCGRVTRIGHSASLVQMWVVSTDEITVPSWVPDRDRAEIQLRVAGPGTMEYLERCYNRGDIDRWGDLSVGAGDEEEQGAQKTARTRLKQDYAQGPPIRRRPELRLYEGYARPQLAAEQVTTRGSVFSPHMIVRTLERESGPYEALDLLCVPQVAQRWRDAILTQMNSESGAVRSLLSGHDYDGSPLKGSHLAFAPLAFVGHPFADGHLLGMAIVLPEEVDSEVRRQALRAIARTEQLVLGRLGVWRIASLAAVKPPWNLGSFVWTAHPDGATHWSTVTPIAFDRHPKEADRSSYQNEVAAMIAQACARIELPEPREVIVTSVSAHLGVPPAHEFPRLERKDGSLRRHAHAILVFDEPVRGPILLGAGRYRGYGVCRPLHDESAST